MSKKSERNIDNKSKETKFVDNKSKETKFVDIPREKIRFLLIAKRIEPHIKEKIEYLGQSDKKYFKIENSIKYNYLLSGDGCDYYNNVQKNEINHRLKSYNRLANTFDLNLLRRKDFHIKVQYNPTHDTYEIFNGNHRTALYFFYTLDTHLRKEYYDLI